MTTAQPSWAELDDTIKFLAAPTRGRDATAGRRAFRRYADLLLITDSLVILISLTVATLGRFGTDASVRLLGIPTDYWLIAGFIAVTWILALAAYRSRDVRIIGAGSTEYRRVAGATAMLFGLDAIVMIIINADLSRGFFVIAFPLGLVGLLGTRRVWRGWLMRKRRRGEYTSATLVVGPRADVLRVLANLRLSKGSAYRPVGVVLDECDTDTAADSFGVPIVASVKSLAEEVRELGVDVVIVAGQPAGPDFLRDLGWDLERTHAELMIASRLLNVAGPRIHVRPAEGMPLMHVELPSYEGGKHVLKRAFDMAVAFIAIVVLAPLLLVIAVLIKITSPGPVLFRQARVGRNGNLFSMIKFRSMVPDAEVALQKLQAQSEGNGVLFKLRDDPRVTRIGRVLRKYSLDELPQLWNVLVGNMSLVGPRPPLQSEVRLYEEHVLRRLYIKPGLTGMWQINGRSNLSWEESVRLDLYYVENWSLTGDLVIIWRTVKVVLETGRCLLRISMIGTRGVPAAYGGFETAVEEIGSRLVERGHDVVVYCRRGPVEAPATHLGMRLVHLPALRMKIAETLSHTGLSTIHAVTHRAPDAAFVFNAANAPFVPLLRARGIPVALHMDGLEWKRDKWSGAGRAYYQSAEAAGVRFANALIADAQGIADYYRERYGADTELLSYGAPIQHNPRSDRLPELGLHVRGYHLVVARFEPENHVSEVVRGYAASTAELPLVVVGTAPYAAGYVREIQALAAADPRIRLLGGVWDQELLDQVYAGALDYLHGHSVGGTNPSLLRAMGAGTAVNAFDVGFNREVVGELGRYFSTPVDIAGLIARSEADREGEGERGRASRQLAADRYDWDAVTDGYEVLAERLASGSLRRVPRERPAAARTASAPLAREVDAR